MKTLFALILFLSWPAFADFSWMPGGYAPAETPLATKYFTPEIRIDEAYHYSFNNPADDTISGSSEAGGVTQPAGATNWMPDLVTSEDRVTAAMMVRL